MTIVLYSCSSSISDAEEKKYDTVEIGSQIWLTKNLNSAKFLNGDDIKHVYDSEQWMQSIRNSTPAWCYYEFNDSLGVVYGKIYNVFAVMDKRGIAPEGFRIASNEDWNKLIDSIGLTKAYVKLREKGTEHWFDDKKKATNETMFTAIPGGYGYGKEKRAGTGLKFEGLGSTASWWSSTIEKTGTNNRYALNGNSRLDKMASRVWDGHYVRCVKTSENKDKSDLKHQSKATIASKEVGDDSQSVEDGEYGKEGVSHYEQQSESLSIAFEITSHQDEEYSDVNIVIGRTLHKIEVVDGMGLKSVEREDFSNLSIPENAVKAVQNYWSGLLTVFYITKDTDSVLVMRGIQDEQDEGQISFKEIARF